MSVQLADIVNGQNTQTWQMITRVRSQSLLPYRQWSIRLQERDFLSGSYFPEQAQKLVDEQTDWLSVKRTPVLRLATFNVENLLMRCDFHAVGVEDLR